MSAWTTVAETTAQSSASMARLVADGDDGAAPCASARSGRQSRNAETNVVIFMNRCVVEGRRDGRGALDGRMRRAGRRDGAPRGPVVAGYTGCSIDRDSGVKNFGPASVMYRQSSWRIPNSP